MSRIGGRLREVHLRLRQVLTALLCPGILDQWLLNLLTKRWPQATCVLARKVGHTFKIQLTQHFTGLSLTLYIMIGVSNDTITN